MVKIAFVEPDGRLRSCEAEEGATIRDVAVQAGISGIIGMCGGYANCGTCHVFVDQKWLDILPPIGEAEEMMLEGAACERQPGSRLACQITVGAKLDGIVLTVPERQD